MANEIDMKLKSADLPIFFRRKLVFKEASNSDDGLSLLRDKYKPINKVSVKPTYSDRSIKPAEFSAKKTNATQIEVDLLLGWKEIRKIGPGLSNLGNTCFLNSVLQCLTYCPPLVNFLIKSEHSRNCKKEGFCLICEMETHIHLCIFNEQKKSAICPKNIVANLKLIAKHFKFGRQEDAHEFIRFLVDGMQKNESKFSKSAMIKAIFEGSLRSTVTCSVCSHKSITIDPFMDLSLEIRHCDSLTKALSHFSLSEKLADRNRYKCEKCKILVNAEKSIAVETSPPVLTIQFKRFSITPLGDSIKIGKMIEFSETLALKTVSGILNYKLFAVLVHSGSSCNSGHYFCFVKGSNDAWYCMNDSTVNQVSLNTVLKQQAYILFYQKEHKSAIADAKAEITPVAKKEEQRTLPTPISKTPLQDILRKEDKIEPKEEQRTLSTPITKTPLKEVLRKEDRTESKPTPTFATSSWKVDNYSSKGPAVLIENSVKYSWDSVPIGKNPYKKRISEYDELYDAGKLKKVKSKDETSSYCNPFQKLQTRENRIFNKK